MAFDLVLFGGTGDLAWRKLMPAAASARVARDGFAWSEEE